MEAEFSEKVHEQWLTCLYLSINFLLLKSIQAHLSSLYFQLIWQALEVQGPMLTAYLLVSSSTHLHQTLCNSGTEGVPECFWPLSSNKHWWRYKPVTQQNKTAILKQRKSTEMLHIRPQCRQMIRLLLRSSKHDSAEHLASYRPDTALSVIMLLRWTRPSRQHNMPTALMILQTTTQLLLGSNPHLNPHSPALDWARHRFFLKLSFQGSCGHYKH